MRPAKETSVSINPVGRESLDRFAQSGQLYSVLDSCNQTKVWKLSRELPGQSQSLYQNQAAEEYAPFAPYLFKTDERLLRWIDDELANTPFGIFIESELEPDVLRSHLRKFLLVEGPKDRRLYFRFYDPRVIDGFLVTASAEVASRFFGPIKSFIFYCPDDELFQIKLAGAALAVAENSGRRQVKVSREHILAMAEHSKLKFAQRLNEHLAASLPARSVNIPDELLETKIENGILNAEFYALTTEADIARYIEIMCIGFPESVEAKDNDDVRLLMFDRRVEIPQRLENLEAMVCAPSTG